MSAKPTITQLEIAKSPAKERILKMLDTLRDEVERGEILALLALTIRTDEEFDVISVGEIRLATLAGMLGRAHLDALEAMRST
jgi:DNA-binding transcriptional ArsR family regulator